MKKVGYIAWPRALERGTVLDDEALHVSLTAEDALRYDGLWPGGHTSRLFELSTDDTPRASGARMQAKSWTVDRELPAKDAIEELSAAFVDFESEMLEEQLLWRQALTPAKPDPAEVEEALREAIDARALRHWSLVRSPSPEVLRRASTDPQGFFTWCGAATKAAWEAWDKEADEDEAIDLARRVAWNAWYHPVMFDADEAYGAHDDVSPRVSDIWASLVTNYVGSQGWVDTEPERLTVGIREAYAHGLVLVKPTGRGVLQWAM